MAVPAMIQTWSDPAFHGRDARATGVAQIDRIVNFVRTEKTQPWGSHLIGVGNAETMHSS